MKTTAKIVTVPLMALTLLASSFVFPVRPANAALSVTGPLAPVPGFSAGFPQWYQDSNNMKLGLQTVADGPLGLAAAVDGANPYSVALGFGAESFYWSADAEVTLPGGGSALLIMATEAAFAPAETPTVGLEQVFNRIRVRLLSPTVPGVYTITHPYGTTTVDTAVNNTVTEDLGCVVTPGVIDACSNSNPATPGETFFSLLENPVAGGAIGAPWLTLASGTITPFGGKNYISGTGAVVGSPTGNNLFRVVDPLGAPVETTSFTVTGVLFAPIVKVTSQTVFVENANTVTGTVSDPTSDVNVTVGANTNVVATVNPNGIWSAALPTPLGTGKFDVTVTTGLGTANESSTTVVNALSVNPATTSIYRLYNTRTGAQVYTRGDAEREFILNKFTDFEFTDGVAAFSTTTTEQPGLTPIFRLYNTRTGMHLYTRGVADRDFVLNKFTDFEFTDGVPAFYASMTAQTGLTPMFRLFETNIGAHVYARGETERAFLLNKFPAFEFTDGVPAFFGVVN